MKQIVLALIFIVLLGCNRSQPTPWTPPAPQPVNPVNPTPLPAPSVITEAHNGKTFSVDVGQKLTISLGVNSDVNYFWSIGVVSGDFDTVSDLKQGGKEVFVVQCNASGTLKLTYTQFTDTGSIVISEITYGVSVK